MATAALYCTDAAPSWAFPVEEYAAVMFQFGKLRAPKDSQNTAKSPITIIEKKLPMIHSKMSTRMRRTGPVKKKIPLEPRC